MSFTEHVEEQLARIKEKNEELNILLFLDEDGALRKAKELDTRDKRDLGRLAGKTVVLKANISVTDWPISCASKTLENYKGTFDADVVTKLKEEDAILLGVANCDEFASGSSGENSAFGATKNPVCPDRIPGGSSSGSAAAVAAGFADLALGSDTGGSIRNPASHCGVVGIKPSYGKVSRYGLVDLSMSLDQIGPFARSVEDAGILLDVIAGHSDFDPSSKKFPENIVPETLIFAWSKEFEELCSNKELLSQVQTALEKIGTPKQVRLRNIKLAVQAYYPLVYTEFFSGTRKFDGRKYGKKIEDSCGEEVLRRILGGQIISEAEYGGQYYRKALAAKQLISEDLQHAFAEADVLVSPVTPRLPHKFGEQVSTKDMYSYDAFTIPANLAGCCAASVPLGELDGVPFGVHLMAPEGCEATLLKAMQEFERLKD